MRARRQSGFTLLEVVIAFVLLSMVLATVFQVFSTGLARTGDLAEQSQALTLAQSRLASVGVEEAVKEGELNGESADRHYRWTISIARHEEKNEAGTVAQASYMLYRVESKVTWRGADGRDHEVKLASLQLGAKQ